MTPDEAMNRLLFHTQPDPGSFLEMLRPYRGLRNEVLADLSRSLRACASHFSDERLPRALMSAVWAISHLGRSWALDPDGMLRRNQLISEDDQATVAAFVARFDYAVMMLLGNSPDEAFADWPSDS